MAVFMGEKTSKEQKLFAGKEEIYINELFYFYFKLSGLFFLQQLYSYVLVYIFKFC